MNLGEEFRHCEAVVEAELLDKLGGDGERVVSALFVPAHIFIFLIPAV